MAAAALVGPNQQLVFCRETAATTVTLCHLRASFWRNITNYICTGVSCLPEQHNCCDSCSSDGNSTSLEGNAVAIEQSRALCLSLAASDAGALTRSHLETAHTRTHTQLLSVAVFLPQTMFATRLPCWVVVGAVQAAPPQLTNAVEDRAAAPANASDDAASTASAFPTTMTACAGGCPTVSASTTGIGSAVESLGNVSERSSFFPEGSTAAVTHKATLTTDGRERAATTAVGMTAVAKPPTAVRAFTAEPSAALPYGGRRCESFRPRRGASYKHSRTPSSNREEWNHGEHRNHLCGTVSQHIDEALPCAHSSGSQTDHGNSVTTSSSDSQIRRVGAGGTKKSIIISRNSSRATRSSSGKPVFSAHTTRASCSGWSGATMDKRLLLQQHVLVLLLSLFLVAVRHMRTTALRYEDEAGLNDWLIVNVGPVTHMLYSDQHNNSGSSPVSTADADVGSPHFSEAERRSGKLIVGTNRGVVAALVAASGRLLWRRVHRESDSVTKLEKVGASYLLAACTSVAAAERPQQPRSGEPHQQMNHESFTTPTAGDTHIALYIYDETQGDLLWSIQREHKLADFRILSAPTSPSTTAATPLGEQRGDVVLLLFANGVLEARDIVSGKILWKQQPQQQWDLLSADATSQTAAAAALTQGHRGGSSGTDVLSLVGYWPNTAGSSAASASMGKVVLLFQQSPPQPQLGGSAVQQLALRALRLPLVFSDAAAATAAHSEELLHSLSHGEVVEKIASQQGSSSCAVLRTRDSRGVKVLRPLLFSSSSSSAAEGVTVGAPLPTETAETMIVRVAPLDGCVVYVVTREGSVAKTNVYGTGSTEKFESATSLRLLLTLKGHWAMGSLAPSLHKEVFNLNWNFGAAHVEFSAAATLNPQAAVDPKNVIVLSRIEGNLLEALLVDTSAGRIAPYISTMLELQKRESLVEEPPQQYERANAAANAAGIHRDVFFNVRLALAVGLYPASEETTAPVVQEQARRQRGLFVVLSDGSLSLTVDKKWLWTREEALAEIRSVAMYTMPFVAKRHLERGSSHWSAAAAALLVQWLPAGLRQRSSIAALKEEAAVAMTVSREGFFRGAQIALTSLHSLLVQSCLSAALFVHDLITNAFALLQQVILSVEEAAAQALRTFSTPYKPPNSPLIEERGEQQNPQQPFSFACLSVEQKLRLLGFNVKIESAARAAEETGPISEGQKIDAAQAAKDDTCVTPVVQIDPRLFGWTDLIFAATCTDQVYALHAATGLIIWQRRVGRWSSAASAAAASSACSNSSRLDSSLFYAAAANNGQATDLWKWQLQGGLGLEQSSTYSSPNSSGKQKVSGEESAATTGGIVKVKLLGAQKKQLLVVFVDPVAPSTQLVWLEAVTGELLHALDLPFQADIVVPLQSLNLYHHKMNKAVSAATEEEEAVAAAMRGEDLRSFFESSGVVLVDSELNVYLAFPAQSLSVQLQDHVNCLIADHLSDHLTLYKLRTVDEQQLVGFFLRPQRLPELPEKHRQCRLMLQRAWSVDFGPSGIGQQIISTARPLHSNFPHVPVVVTGSISIVYKYINPNLLLLVTQARHPSGSNEAEKSSLMLNLINLIDGSLVYLAPLPLGASLPLHVAMYDNVVVAHYWNVFHSRYELHIVELQDAQRDEGPLSIIVSAARHVVPTLSGFQLPIPSAFSETYIFPSGVRTLGVSATHQGITTRALLAATAGSQQIYSLSAQYANARRPRIADAMGRPLQVLSQEQQQHLEEGILPYHPLIPLLPQDCISYFHQVFFVRGITSHPSARESTSLTFAFGLDLLFSPLQPAKGYDVLNSRFNYGLLTAAIATLASLVIFTRWRAKEADLATKWK